MSTTFGTVDASLVVPPAVAGAEHVYLRDLKACEEISSLFEIRLTLAASNHHRLQFEQWIGHPMSVRLAEVGSSASSAGAQPIGPRFFHGVVAELSELQCDHDFTYYECRLVPTAWRLTQCVRHQIFSRQTVPQVLRKVLVGFPVEFRLRGSYGVHNYCVQYGESDFDFACRLMEEEGIYYHFEHGLGKHTLIVSDEPVSQLASLPAEEVAYHRGVVEVGQIDPSLRGVWSWTKRQKLGPTKWLVDDYSFQVPQQSLLASHSVEGTVEMGTASHKLAAGDGPAMQVYEYPGSYAHRLDPISPNGNPTNDDVGMLFPDRNQIGRLRMEQAAMELVASRGAGNRFDFTPGAKMKLKGHFDGDGEYLITAVTHEVHFGGLGLREHAKLEGAYRNELVAHPAAMTFRPRRKTPKPKVIGPQSATVVGPAGQQIFTDKFGRVQVEFPWSRSGEGRTAGSSCWLRVSQAWAGENFGAIFLPRIGQEVLVAFEHGDPDQPIVVGSVYNARQMPPFQLPTECDVTGFKSRTVQGSPGEFHGFAMRDTSGKEMMQLRSQRDIIVNAANSHALNVANQHSETIGAYKKTVVGSLFGGGSGSGGDDGMEAVGVASAATSPSGQGSGTSIVTQTSSDAVEHASQTLLVDQGSGSGCGGGALVGMLVGGALAGLDYLGAQKGIAPCQWVWDEVISPMMMGGLDTYTVGSYTLGVVGIQENYTVGPEMNCVLGLTAFSECLSGHFGGLAGGRFMAGLEAVKVGAVDLKMAYASDLTFGMRVNAYHGECLEMVGTSSVVTTPMKVMTTLFSTVAAGTLVAESLPPADGVDTDVTAVTLPSTIVRAVLLGWIENLEYVSAMTNAATNSRQQATNLQNAATLVEVAAPLVGTTLATYATTVSANAVTYLAQASRRLGASAGTLGNATDKLEQVSGNYNLAANNMVLQLPSQLGATAQTMHLLAAGNGTNGHLLMQGSASTILQGGETYACFAGGEDPSITIDCSEEGSIMLQTGAEEPVGSVSLKSDTGVTIQSTLESKMQSGNNSVSATPKAVTITAGGYTLTISESGLAFRSNASGDLFTVNPSAFEVTNGVGKMGVAAPVTSISSSSTAINSTSASIKATTLKWNANYVGVAE